MGQLVSYNTPVLVSPVRTLITLCACSYSQIGCSPTTTSIERVSASFRKNHDDIDFGVDVKLRSNGSKRSLHAVPNPYSNSELLDIYGIMSHNHTHLWMHGQDIYCILTVERLEYFTLSPWKLRPHSWSLATFDLSTYSTTVLLTVGGCTYMYIRVHGVPNLLAMSGSINKLHNCGALLQSKSWHSLHHCWDPVTTRWWTGSVQAS